MVTELAPFIQKFHMQMIIVGTLLVFAIVAFILGGICYRIRGGASDVLETPGAQVARIFWAGTTSAFIGIMTFIYLKAEPSIQLAGWQYLSLLSVPFAIFAGLHIPHAWGQSMGDRMIFNPADLQKKRDQFAAMFGWLGLKLPEYSANDSLFKRRFQDFRYMSYVGIARSCAFLPLIVIFGWGALFFPLLGILHGVCYLVYPYLPDAEIWGKGNSALIHGHASWAEFFWGGCQWVTLFMAFLLY